MPNQYNMTTHTKITVVDNARILIKEKNKSQNYRNYIKLKQPIINEITYNVRTGNLKYI